MFPEVREDHSSLHICFYLLFFSSSWEGYTAGEMRMEKGKQSCLFCRESWLKGAWRPPVVGQGTLRVSEEFVIREGNFGSEVDWARMASRCLCLSSVWGDANRTQSPWREKDPPFHCWGGQRTGSLIPVWLSPKYLPEHYFGRPPHSKDKFPFF